MTKRELDDHFRQFRRMLKVTRRIVNQFPEDRLDFRPTPEVRSVAELVAHNYSFLTEAVRSVALGRHVPASEPRFVRKSELLSWIDEQVSEFFTGIAKISDVQLVSRIQVWGESYAGWQLLDLVYQEHLHHRGQLTLYLRLLGITPISVYDYHD